MFCQKNTRMVDAMKKAHEAKFEVSMRPAGEHKDELAAHGIESHGVVCVSADGEMLWKHADHEMSQDQLDAGVKAVLAKLK